MLLQEITVDMSKLKLCKYFQTPVSYLLKIVNVISDEEIGKETLWLRLMFGSTETENKLNYVKNLFRKQLNIFILFAFTEKKVQTPYYLAQ